MPTLVPTATLNTWLSMRTANHAWYTQTKTIADTTTTPTVNGGGGTYGDDGTSAAIMYQITVLADPGNTAQQNLYAARAWSIISLWTAGGVIANMTLPFGQNSVDNSRQTCCVIPYNYDLLLPWLTANGHDAEYRAWMTWLGRGMLGFTNGCPNITTRMGAEDPLATHMLSLAMLDALSLPGPGAIAWTSQTWTDPAAGSTPVGGLNATGQDFTSMRNAWSLEVALSAGGCFVQGGEYTLNTPELMAIGYKACLTGFGADHFPEFAAFLTNLAKNELALRSPNLLVAYEEGDWEARDLRYDHREPLDGACANFTHGTAFGPFMARLSADNIAASLLNSACIYAMFFPPDPALPQSALTGAPALFQASTGTARGISALTTGWTANDRACWLQGPAQSPFDHTPYWTSNAALFGKGEWLLDATVGYQMYPAPAGISPWTSCLPQGLQQVNEASGTVAYDSGTWWLMRAGACGGRYYIVLAPPYAPPPRFVTELICAQVYLPGVASDVVLFFDRANMVDPIGLGIGAYNPPAKALLQQAPALFQRFIHAPNGATPTATGAKWTTTGAQNVSASILYSAPGSSIAIVANIDTLAAPAASGQPIVHMHVQPGIGAFVTLNPTNAGLPWGARETLQVQSVGAAVAGVYPVTFELNLSFNHVINETVNPELIGGTGGPLDPGELQQVVRLSNNVHGHQTALSAVVAGNATVTTVTSVGGEVRAALVARPGDFSAMVVWNARPTTASWTDTSGAPKPGLLGIIGAGRLQQTGWTLNWNAVATTKVLLLDLNPALPWTVSIDGGPPSPLTVSAAGAAEVTVIGAGAYSMVLGNGPAPPPAPSFMVFQQAVPIVLPEELDPVRFSKIKFVPAGPAAPSFGYYQTIHPAPIEEPPRPFAYSKMRNAPGKPRSPIPIMLQARPDGFMEYQEITPPVIVRRMMRASHSRLPTFLPMNLQPMPDGVLEKLEITPAIILRNLLMRPGPPPVVAFAGNGSLGWPMQKWVQNAARAPLVTDDIRARVGVPSVCGNTAGTFTCVSITREAQRRGSRSRDGAQSGPRRLAVHSQGARGVCARGWWYGCRPVCLGARPRPIRVSHAMRGCRRCVRDGGA